MSISTEMTRAHTSPPGMMFYDSFESVRRDIGLLGYVSVIGRAWHKMELGGVLCLDNRPVLYVKEDGRRPFSSRERIRLQRLFWNQGVANVLVLADPVSVHIYSGLATPQKEQSDEDEAHHALVEMLTLTDYVRQMPSFCHKLATGHYYETKKRHFDPNQSVDSWLLDNLRAFRNALLEGDDKLSIREAHAFIGRVLFLCYLLDREIISAGNQNRKCTGTMRFAETLENRRSDASRLNCLYKYFADIKKQFNGNMFDQDIDIEKKRIRPHLKKLILFFGGHDVGSGQRSLGFWPYDFKMIPVETISAIYEDFLTTENPEKQRKHGAFYTPRFLAEMVVDVATHGEPDAYNWSFLDPTCGSGIFLVILFNRLANHWLHNQVKKPHYLKIDETLRNILARQISGADIEETACRIACFSLYLAYLDFFNPPDIKEYIKKTGKQLPRLLDYRNDPDRPAADIPVIYRGDSLDDETLSGQTFNCVVGNPPWEGRQSKQIAQKFVQKTPEFLKNGGIGCFLLPSKIFQNQTDAFQSEWLGLVTLEKIIQLADYRRLLFQNAKTPAIIERFKNSPPKPDHSVEFNAPKFNRDGLRQGLITVNPSARTWIPLADILVAARSKTASVVWKRCLWGTHRDKKLLNLLQSLPPLSDMVGTPKEGKPWIKGQGFQPYYPEKAENDPKYPKPKLNTWSLDKSFIHTEQSLRMIVFQQDCMTFGKRLESIGGSKEYLRRDPNKKIFKSPMVLVSQGFGKVAYCGFDVLFQHSLQSIAGPREDTDLLMFLAAYLRSDLARYFLFHTSANWGSERPKVHLKELLRVPFPLPEDDFVSPNAEQIIKQIAKKIVGARKFLQNKLDNLKSDAQKYAMFDGNEEDIRKEWHRERKRRVDALQKEIKPLIYRYFGLTEQEIILIEDTVRIFEPSSTPENWRSEKTLTLDPLEKARVEPYTSQGLKAYADTLTKTLNTWAEMEDSEYRLCAEGGTDDKTGLAMLSLKLSRAELAYQQKLLHQDLMDALKVFHTHASKKEGSMIYERDILFFRKNKIHIIRPNILLNWTRTSALNDAARIYGDIMLATEEF